jgi:formylglycine-generating enzyme required for sulfatase activity
MITGKERIRSGGMTGTLRRIGVIALILACAVGMAPMVAQDAKQAGRYALVIGNSSYLSLGTLKNPGNDAADMADALRGIGFEVSLLVNADLVQMEKAVVKLGSQLAASPSSTGFFYYAGHGVQMDGVNYLIPADARIESEDYLKYRALAAQSVLDILQRAGNGLNIVVLDACRDNPFGWARSGSRGLSVVSNQPPGSIVVYATSAGSTALDGGSGERNGKFTAELLKHIGTPGVEIKEVFNLTGAGVLEATSGKQTPAVYNQFFGKAYLAGMPVSAVPPSITAMELSGSLLIRAESAGTLYLDGTAVGEIRKGGAKRLADLEVGDYELEIRYPTGERESRSLTVAEGKETEVQFLWKAFVPPATTTTSSTTTTTLQQKPQSFIDMVLVQGGTFMMGSNSGDPDEKPVNKVTLSSFMIGKYEVTQAQYLKAMGNNPSYFKNASDASKLPVETVTWYDAVTFCNKLSEIEGFQKVYSISGADVTVDLSKNGYRLPTKAEWEYAARGGNQSNGYTYSGSDDIDRVAWYDGNSFDSSHAVGSKSPNELGLYDFSGNVWEWCWDSLIVNSEDYKAYMNPMGVAFGEGRILCGGAFFTNPYFLRLDMQFYSGTGNKHGTIGFRVLRQP